MYKASKINMGNLAKKSAPASDIHSIGSAD